jgi:hypothetical protein
LSSPAKAGPQDVFHSQVSAKRTLFAGVLGKTADETTPKRPNSERPAGHHKAELPKPAKSLLKRPSPQWRYRPYLLIIMSRKHRILFFTLR